MKKLVLIMFGVYLGLLISVACTMGSPRNKRLVSDVDQANLHWYPCNQAMIGPDFAGKLCLVQCEIELEKDGKCKKDKYKYVSKIFKDEHEFFSKMIMVPSNQVY